MLTIALYLLCAASAQKFGTKEGTKISIPLTSEMNRGDLAAVLTKVSSQLAELLSGASTNESPLVSYGEAQREKCHTELKAKYHLNERTIHSISPYKNFVPSKYGVKGAKVTNWGLDKDVFDAVLQIVKPKLHIEVGSWKGSSVIYVANKMRELHAEGECLMLVSVDTWLGTTHAWHNEDMENPIDGNDLHLRNGYPSVYYQFLHNIMSAKVDDMVIPLPLPGTMGALYVEQKKARPDTVYLDGCHDEICVLQDIQGWFPLVRDGGYLMGDDYNRPGVQNAVKRFCDDEPKCIMHEEITKKSGRGLKGYKKSTWVMEKRAV